VVGITYLYTRNYFPPDQASKVGKKYIDWLKDNPPDKTIDKTICILVKSTEDGNIMVIGIGEVGKGKEKEALEHATRQSLFLAKEVEGFKYKIEVVLNFTEAYKIIGMDAPDV
jgi:hypothetical protein